MKAWQKWAAWQTFTVTHFSEGVCPLGLLVHFPAGAHLGCRNQHSCSAEAYKPRERSFQGRKLRHLVTSKSGRNQASGSFLSAVSYSRYTAGCMVGGVSPRSLQNCWRKHYSGYFYTGFSLIKRPPGTFTDSRKKKSLIHKNFLWQALCLAQSDKKGDAVLWFFFVRRKFM